MLQRALNRVWRLALDVPIRFKILGIGVGIATLFGLATLWVVRASISDTLTFELRDSGVLLTENLARQAEGFVAVDDRLAVHQLLARLRESHSDIVYAMVLDPSGGVVADTFERGVPGDLLTFGTTPSSDTVVEYLESEDDRIWDFASPLTPGVGGVARIGVSERAVDSALDRTSFGIFVTFWVCSAIGILFAVVLTRIITRPVLDLVKATNRVAKGDLDGEATVYSEDEIGGLSRSLNHMIGTLREYRREVGEKEAAQARLLQAAVTAQEGERRRISRELHDGVGQALTFVLIRLRILVDSEPSEDFRRSLLELREQVSATLDEIRATARELRPSILDDLGVVKALQRHVEDFSTRTEVHTDFHATGFDSDERLASHLQSALYRVGQEALTNVAKHSNARRASVVIQRAQGRVLLTVEDDGDGFDVDSALRDDAHSRSVGLLGMRERAELVGGRLTVESSAASGTSVRLDVYCDVEGEP